MPKTPPPFQWPAGVQGWTLQDAKEFEAETGERVDLKHVLDQRWSYFRCGTLVGLSVSALTLVAVTIAAGGSL